MARDPPHIQCSLSPGSPLHLSDGGAGGAPGLHGNHYRRGGECVDTARKVLTRALSGDTLFLPCKLAISPDSCPTSIAVVARTPVGNGKWAPTTQVMASMEQGRSGSIVCI